MERLTKRMTESTIELSAKANPFQFNGSPQRVHVKHPFWNVFDRLCKYEDKQEQGLIAQCTCGECIHVDCAGCSGDTVYCTEIGAYRNINDSCNKAEAAEALAKMGE